jgi:hypothetical protein
MQTRLIARMHRPSTAPTGHAFAMTTPPLRRTLFIIQHLQTQLTLSITIVGWLAEDNEERAEASLGSAASAGKESNEAEP